MIKNIFNAHGGGLKSLTALSLVPAALLLAISTNAYSGVTVTLTEPVNNLDINVNENGYQQSVVKIDSKPFDVFTLKESQRAQADLPSTILITLSNGNTVNAVFKKFTTGPDGSIVWEGIADGVATDKVFLAVKDSVVQGNINVGSERFLIRYLSEDASGDALHLITHLDPSTLPPEHDPSEPLPVGEGSAFAQDTFPGDVSADNGSVVDIMVAYTAPARTAVGGQSAMDALINLAVAETNAGYQNSNVAFTINLVHTALTGYVSSGSFSTDLANLRGLTDGNMDNLHTLRDIHGADLVSLLIDNQQYCGIGYLNSSAATAFSVTAWNCATGNYSFAHEFGHNQGARHDWAADNTNNSNFTYNHGYVNPSEQWRTIMAYNNSSCTNGYCQRLNYWSNPNVSNPSTGSVMGIPEGSTNASENWKTLNNTAFQVANFRQSGDIYEPDDTFQTASTITTGVPQLNHNINNGGSDVDWVKFTLSCTADVVIETSGTTGDTRMWLYDGTGTTQLAYNDDGGASFFSKITQTSLLPGDYYIKVDEFSNNDEISNYTISFDRTCNTVALCFGQNVTVYLGNGDTPTNGADVILGTAGNDTINGLNGADLICGLGGNDIINGGYGNDWVQGGSGSDTINGDAGNDLLFGEAGADTINGGDGADYIGGNDGFDTLSGGNGADEIYGDSQNDIINGDAGNDTLYGGPGVDGIDGGDGDDTIYTGTGKTVASAYKVLGGKGADTIYGGLSDDHIEGGPGKDTIYGDGGNDYIDGGASADIIYGENGADTILGGGQGDRLDGGAGNDTIKGETGSDVIYGGVGNDTLNGNDGNDSIRGNEGRDTIRGGNGDDYMAGNAGVDYCNGGLGTDTAISTCETVLLVP